MNRQRVRRDDDCQSLTLAAPQRLPALLTGEVGSPVLIYSHLLAGGACFIKACHFVVFHCRRGQLKTKMRLEVECNRDFDRKTNDVRYAQACLRQRVKKHNKATVKVAAEGSGIRLATRKP